MNSFRVLVFVGGLFWATAASAANVTVFAAASLKTALDQIAIEWREVSAQSITLVFAASSTIARQVDHGAPADVIVLASDAWMDWLQERDQVRLGSRVSLLGNTLVLIASDPHAAPLVPEPGFPLAARLGSERLAMGLVDAVPVGIYGKAALSNLGVWAEVAPKVAQTDNARAALALVAAGEAPFGIVYASDALADPRVTKVGEFPPESHPSIRYPLALGLAASVDAEKFVTYLQGQEAAHIFGAQGFAIDE